MNYLLLHTPAWSPAALSGALTAARVEARVVASHRDLAPDDRPTVLLLDADSRSTFPLDVLRGFVDAGASVVALGRPGDEDVPEALPTELLSGFVRHPAGARQLLVAVRAGVWEAAARAETARARAEGPCRDREIGELPRIVRCALGLQLEGNAMCSDKGSQGGNHRCSAADQPQAQLRQRALDPGGSRAASGSLLQAHG